MLQILQNLLIFKRYLVLQYMQKQKEFCKENITSVNHKYERNFFIPVCSFFYVFICLRLRTGDCLQCATTMNNVTCIWCSVLTITYHGFIAALEKFYFQSKMGLKLKVFVGVHVCVVVCCFVVKWNVVGL